MPPLRGEYLKAAMPDKIAPPAKYCKEGNKPA